MVVADTLSRSPCKLEKEPDTVEDVQHLYTWLNLQGQPQVISLRESEKQVQRMSSS